MDEIKAFQRPEWPGEKTVNGFRLSGRVLILATTLIGLSFAPPMHAQEPSGNAQVEKKLVLYHSPNVPDTERMLAGFRKKYPFVEVETYRASGEKLIQRITTEARAGKHLSDAYLLSGFQTWLLKSMGMLLPYPSLEREKVLAALKDADGYWTGVYWNLEVLAYNTKLVRSAEVPKAWEDLSRRAGKDRLPWKKKTSIGTPRSSSSWGRRRGRSSCVDWRRNGRRSALAIHCSPN